MTAARDSDTERLLTFEVQSGVYALPIAEVHEVAEAKRIRCVPTIARDQVGVMNWHGDALPVVSATLLLDACEADLACAADDTSQAPSAGRETQPGTDGRVASEPQPTGDAQSGLGGPHLLVVSSRDDEPAQLGIPIDRVIGLVDGVHRRRGAGQLVVERRSVEGRVVSVLDPRRLVERATEVIERVV